MRRSRALIGLLSLLLLLPGCWDMRELEESNYVIAVGIDKGKKDRLAVTFVLADPHDESGGGDKGKEKEKGGGGDKGEKGSKGKITVEASTISGANFYMNTVVPRPTSLAQTKLILVSEELVKSEGMIFLDELSRNRNLRRSTMLVVTKQPVKEILDAIPPGPEGLNDFAFLQNSSESKRSGFIPKQVSLNDFLIRASTAYQAPVTYYAALAKPADESEQKAEGAPKEGAQSEGAASGGQEKQGGEAEQGSQGGKAQSGPLTKQDLVPGQSRREGGPKVDFFGAAAFRQNKMVGSLDAEETRAMLLLQNTFSQSNLELVDPNDPKSTGTVRITRGRPTKVKAKLVDGRPQFQVLITLEGEVIGMPALVDYTKADLRDQLETQAADQIKKQVEAFFKKTQEIQADVAGLGRFIVRKLPTVDAWHQFNWPEKYKDAEITVSVRMQLRRFGVQLSPQPTGGREKSE